MLWTANAAFNKSGLLPMELLTMVCTVIDVMIGKFFAVKG
jgi:hypothetical protein